HPRLRCGAARPRPVPGPHDRDRRRPARRPRTRLDVERHGAQPTMGARLRTAAEPHRCIGDGLDTCRASPSPPGTTVAGRRRILYMSEQTTQTRWAAARLRILLANHGVAVASAENQADMA